MSSPSSPEPEDALLMVAGEASGDLHGARLLSELQALHPRVRAFGLGGDEMTAAGFDAMAHSREIAVVGITEALRILPKAWQIFQGLLAEVDRRGARTAVLIDSPDFNLRLAKKLHARGVRVIYYISPQLWAWRRGRIRIVQRYVDKMLVLFPFEKDFYDEHGVDACHVGHPLIDEVPALPQAWDESATADTPRTVALLPGSRKSEVRRILPLQLAAAARMVELLQAQNIELRLRLIQAPTVPSELFDRLIDESPLDPERLERVKSERFRAISGSHLALCASGTATIEVGLLGTPMVVVYRISPASAFLARLLLKLEHVAMVNLVLGRGVVPELLQGDAAPDNVARQAAELLVDRDAIAQMRDGLGELRQSLGAEGGASKRAAQEVAAVLQAPAEGSAS